MGAERNGKQRNVMSDDKETFSANLMSLQLQLKTLLEEAGGDDVVSLLDALCRISGSEQKVALKAFVQIIDRINSGDLRLSSSKDECKPPKK